MHGCDWKIGVCRPQRAEPSGGTACCSWQLLQRCCLPQREASAGRAVRLMGSGAKAMVAA
jgi:hypothetical protein